MVFTEFNALSNDLRNVAKKIPLEWGHIQNNEYDNQLKRNCNIFEVFALDDLEKAIVSFDEDHKNYYRRRWYLLRCADCDEYLFYCNKNVVHNPVRFDKEWDILINQKYKFDIKGTVIPKSFREEWETSITDPNRLVEFYYERQSHGVRFDMQNRLFIVHHSLLDPNREFYLRCAWKTKASIYKLFIEQISNIKLITYKGCTAAVIFIIETEQNKLQYNISGLTTGLQSL